MQYQYFNSTSVIQRICKVCIEKQLATKKIQLTVENTPFRTHEAVKQLCKILAKLAKWITLKSSYFKPLNAHHK
jgi:hypothetical protein